MKQNSKSSIAIIGIGCIFPKSYGIKEYWRLISHGIDGIDEIPKTHWSIDDYFDKDPKTPDHVYCKRGGFLSPVAYDLLEFGIPPAALEATDTSQLFGLIAAKMALEDAGYGQNGKSFNKDKTSVILGVTGTQELVISLGSRLGHPIWRKALETSNIPKQQCDEVINKISDSYVQWQENSFPGLLGNVVAGRITNRLDLGGTNTVVDAACASSLSAVNLAVMELLSGRSDMSITGGVDTLNDIFMHTCFSKTSVLSFTGDARPFSSKADGTVLGEGIGLLVLKRLEDAQKANDKIYAVIKSIGSSSDGKSSSIYAPSVKGQAKALRMAYKEADISPKTIELIEAHGTGTKVGDAVEFKALKEVFSEYNIAKNRCAIGSVKSMIGHTKAAAGAAGLIKTALSLYHKIIPPTLKIDKPDPKLDINNSPFYLNLQKKPWITNKKSPRRAGVSSFGFGGSNFHVILEEYEQNKCMPSWDGSVEIFALSNSNIQEVKNQLLLFDQLTKDENSKYSEILSQKIAFEAQKTRQSFLDNDLFKLLIVVELYQDSWTNIFKEALSILEKKGIQNSFSTKNIFFGTSKEKIDKIAFLFPGQGSQYIGMGNDLICCFPEAQKTLKKGNKFFSKKRNNALLSDLIYPPPSYICDIQESELKLRQTDNAQPAIGIISLAMYNILKRFNITPDAVCGHSFGELTALCCGGWIDEDSFLSIAEARGRFMAACGSGSMLAVKAKLEKIKQIVKENSLDLILANLNSNDQGVLSGATHTIQKAKEIFNDKGFISVVLPVSAAFHTNLVKDAAKPLSNLLKLIKITPTNILAFSNTTGDQYSHDQEVIQKNLDQHILKPVNFLNNIKSIYNKGIKTFIEVGPKAVLTGLTKSILKGLDFHALALDNSSGKNFGVSDLAKILCYIASLGYPVNLKEWEEPAKKPAKKSMHMTLTGANYKPKNKNKAPNQLIIKQPNKKTKKLSSSMSTSINPDQNIIKKQTPMDNKNKQMNSDLINNALKVVQEGLKSMQMLQSQTAEAHKIFLETQAQTSQALQNMIDKTKYIIDETSGKEISCHGSLEKQNIIKEPKTHIEDIAFTPQQAAPQTNVNEIEESLSSKQALITDNYKNVGKDPNDKKTDKGLSLIKDTLLEVVSELTGYPIEMLDTAMDIEADLGIDSIKRVEILSALEEKIPNLPSISPDIMGNLKTLGEICNYLSDDFTLPDSIIHDAAQNNYKQENTNPENTLLSVQEEQKDITSQLLKVVSDLTGYPIEMLDTNMDIEADLGIDSIKRVEILSALEENVPNLPPIAPDIMGNLKTLGEISAYLQQSEDTEDQVLNENIISDEITLKKKTPINRYIVKPYPQDINNISYKSSISIPSDRTVLITEDKTGLSKAIAKALKKLKINSKIINNTLIEKPSEISNIGGLIILSDSSSNWDQNLWKDYEFLKQAFRLTSLFAEDIIASGQGKGAIFATITKLDGAFGFKNQPILNPIQGGLSGLSKTAAIEWQNVCCHAIDIDPLWEDNKSIAKIVAKELLNKGEIEVGFDSKQRYTLDTESLSLQNKNLQNLNIDKEEVVVITGGAKGVTSYTAYELAKECQPIIALIGRSDAPFPEPEWLNGIQENSDIKKAILTNEFLGKKITPKELESSFRKYMSNREISSNIEKIKSTGAKVQYYSADIKNNHDINDILNNIRELGPIKAIIHGAGILEDKLIKDKTFDQFEKVLSTKVKGLQNLIECTRNDPVKYIVYFSSVAARYGNKGQADYAMANEVLNKIAQYQNQILSDCNVISINWGPWDGGMVSNALKKQFTQNNISLIPVADGAKYMINEMRNRNRESAEIVIGSSLLDNNENLSNVNPDIDKSLNDNFKSSFQHHINIDNYPILNSHIIGGLPVVPFALITEWLGHSALHENPGLIFHGIDDMRILNGIKLNKHHKNIEVFADKAHKNGEFFEVALEVKNIKDKKIFINSKARVILSENIVPPPEFNNSYIKANSHSYNRSTKDIYDKILFHGKNLQGIQEITNVNDNIMVAKVINAPSPYEWLKEPLRSKWVTDPLILDSAFQMASLWCYDNTGAVSLPSYLSSYRQYTSNFSAQDITVILEMKNLNKHKIIADFTMLGDDKVMAKLTGYEAVIDKSLNKAFKPEGINI